MQVVISAKRKQDFKGLNFSFLSFYLFKVTCCKLFIFEVWMKFKIISFKLCYAKFYSEDSNAQDRFKKKKIIFACRYNTLKLREKYIFQIVEHNLSTRHLASLHLKRRPTLPSMLTCFCVIRRPTLLDKTQDHLYYHYHTRKLVTLSQMSRHLLNQITMIFRIKNISFNIGSNLDKRNRDTKQFSNCIDFSIMLSQSPQGW